MRSQGQGWVANVTAEHASKRTKEFTCARAIHSCVWQRCAAWFVVSNEYCKTEYALDLPTVPTVDEPHHTCGQDRNVGRERILVNALNTACSNPHVVSTTREFGATIGVLHCTMSPKGSVYAHIVQGGGEGGGGGRPQLHSSGECFGFKCGALSCNPIQPQSQPPCNL